MKVRLSTGSFVDAPVNLTAHTVVVFDDYEQPIAVIREVESGGIYLVAADEPEFAKVVESLGVSKDKLATVEVADG